MRKRHLDVTVLPFNHSSLNGLIMSRFGPVEVFASRARLLEDAAGPAFKLRNLSAPGDWLRPGYYLMRLRQYYRNRSRAAFRLAAPFLPRQQNPE